MKHRANCVLAASIATAGLVATAGFAGDEPVIHSWGKQIYERHCASCHGESGKGDGPVAASLKRPSPDLTGIAARGEGQFPRLRIVAIIDGTDPITPHGTREMPVWGDVFAARKDDLGARARIYALVTYLESIQER